MMEVEIYTVRNCGKCKEVKTYLDEKKISFKEVDMSIGGIPELQVMKKAFKEFGLKTYPVTVVKHGDKQHFLEGFIKEEFDGMFPSNYDQ